MGKNFNTVPEVNCWRNFTLDGNIFDLSHLNSHSVTYLDVDNQKEYTFLITYSSHCFTSKIPDVISNQELQLIYKTPTESRLFSLERYHLSKHLPNIIKTLGEKTTLTFHAGYKNYATFKVLDSNGYEVNYFIPFSAFREKKKLRLHITSAYPKLGLGKTQKVNFFAIANNLLTGKKLPQPHITKTP
jgi:hypothetical protein